jgi:hypothetical protein
MFEKLKREHVHSLLSYAFGVVGIILSIYFYTLSVTERQPVLSVSEPRTLVVNTEQTATTKIRVVRLDGSPIKGEVWAMRFYVWNAGKLAIKREHVLVPISLEFQDKSVEILGYSVAHENRPEITRAKVSVADPSKPNRLEVAFDILENRDVIVGQVTYRGSAKTPLHIAGTIEGAENVLPDSPVDWSSVWGNFIYVIFVGVGIIVGFIVVAIISSLIGKVLGTVISEVNRKRIGKISDFAFGTMVVMVILLIIFAATYAKSKTKVPLPTHMTESKQK